MWYRTKSRKTVHYPNQCVICYALFYIFSIFEYQMLPSCSVFLYCRASGDECRGWASLYLTTINRPGMWEWWHAAKQKHGQEGDHSTAMLIRDIKSTFSNFGKYFSLHYDKGNTCWFQGGSNWEWWVRYAEPAHLLLIWFLVNGCINSGTELLLLQQVDGVRKRKTDGVRDRGRWRRRGGKGDHVIQVIKCAGGSDVTLAPTSASFHSLFILSVSVRIVDRLRSDWLVRGARTGIPTNLSWLIQPWHLLASNELAEQKHMWVTYYLHHYITKNENIRCSNGTCIMAWKG